MRKSAVRKHFPVYWTTPSQESCNNSSRQRYPIRGCCLMSAWFAFQNAWNVLSFGLLVLNGLVGTHRGVLYRSISSELLRAGCCCTLPQAQPCFFLLLALQGTLPYAWGIKPAGYCSSFWKASPSWVPCLVLLQMGWAQALHWVRSMRSICCLKVPESCSLFQHSFQSNLNHISGCAKVVYIVLNQVI